MSGWITWITGDSNVDLASAQRVIQELVAERDELRAAAGSSAQLEQQQRKIQELEDTVKEQSRQIALLTRRCSAYCHVLDAEQHITSALRCIDDAKILVIPPPLVICCPSPQAFTAITKAAAAAAPAAIHVVACPALVCRLPRDDATAPGHVELPAAEMMGVQQFQDLLSSGDVFLHGDSSTFTWAYCCRALEQLQVAGVSAVIFGSVQSVVRLRQASLAARCVLVRSVQLGGEKQDTDIPAAECEQLFDLIAESTAVDALAGEVVNFLQKRR